VSDLSLEVLFVVGVGHTGTEAAYACDSSVKKVSAAQEVANSFV
jgi:hypothetical protein